MSIQSEGIEDSQVGSDYYSRLRTEVATLVPAAARRVVDVGCGAGGLGRALKRQRPELEVRGVEIVEAQAKRAKQVLDDAVCAAADAPMPADWPQPDCVIFADVLEHLVDPWNVLRIWKNRLVPGGVIVASIPNVAHFSVIGPLLKGRWDYEDEGLLDRTHLRFFTRQTACEMVSQAGIRVLHLERTISYRRIPSILLRTMTRAWSRHVSRGSVRPRGFVTPLDFVTRQFLIVGEAAT